MFDILWQSGVRSTTTTGFTMHSTIALRWSSHSPSKGAGPWPGSLRELRLATHDPKPRNLAIFRLMISACDG